MRPTLLTISKIKSLKTLKPKYKNKNRVRPLRARGDAPRRRARVRAQARTRIRKNQKPQSSKSNCTTGKTAKQRRPDGSSDGFAGKPEHGDHQNGHVKRFRNDVKRFTCVQAGVGGVKRFMLTAAVFL
ncbi:hypothetical protein [Massilia sp. NP310]|uniref:hypothetical protein n=1 Tax=Massilia sp. NP310 TaxID=2861282 RepID=UPI001C626658|nr:hypothetical protein [Massilia sp. NP310]QYG04021.1 hypothetical protein KY496_11885 [Massilia sp. NP310]